MRAEGHVGHPLHDRRVADDHRLVGLVDADPSLPGSLRTAPAVDPEPAFDPVAAGEEREQTLRGAVTDRHGTQATSVVGDNQERPSGAEVEPVERCHARLRACSRPTRSMMSAPRVSPSAERIRLPIASSRDRRSWSASSVSTADSSSSGVNS